MRITGLPVPLNPGTSSTRTVADAPHGFPCRRCLTDALPGEPLLLLSYDPWTVDSPYRQPGPVFVHERQCPTVSASELQDQQRRRLLSVRAFDASGMPRAAFVTKGSDLDLDRLLSDPQVSFVHLHNAGPGCFSARVDRG
ncbi:MAG: DUF1203 domain-containing protein [Mycobacteriales bacterium]